MILKRSAQGHIITLTDDFKVQEYFCKCGECDYQNISMLLAHRMQELRNLIHRSIHIHSGYRCRIHNAKVGGASNSRHLSGKACDFGVQDMSGIDLARAALAVGFRRIGVAETWIHCDVDPPSGVINVWTYDAVKLADVQAILRKDLMDL